MYYGSLGNFLRSSWLKSMGVGAFAQALTVAASLLPVVLGFGAELIFVIQATAVVSVVLNTISLGVVLRLPALQGARAARRLIVAGLMVSSMCAVAGGISAFFLAFVDSFLWLSRLLTGVAILAPCWTAYVSALSELVRRTDFLGVARLRVVYGVVLISSTIFCCWALPSDVAFLGCSIVSFLVAGIYGLSRTKILLNFSLRITRARLRNFLGECRDGSWLSLSQIVSGLSYQAPGLVTGHVGPYGPMMASTVRLMSGFQTVGGQLVAPQLDIAVVQARKKGYPSVLRRTAVRCLLVALALGVCAAGTTLVAIGWLESRGALEVGSYFGWSGMILLAFGAASLSPISHLLTLVEGARSRIAWDITRAIATVAVLMLATFDGLVLALGVLFTGASLAYAFLYWRQSSRLVCTFSDGEE